MKFGCVIVVLVVCSSSYAEKHSESSVAFSVHGGNADPGKGLYQDSYIAVITGELVESPIGYEFLAIGIGNTSFTEDRIVVGTLGVLLNLVPIDAKWLRVSVGGGGGFAVIEENLHYEKYDQTGGHVVGQGSLTFFSPSLRLGVKAIWLKTRFSGGNVPIIDEANDVVHIEQVRFSYFLFIKMLFLIELREINKIYKLSYYGYLRLETLR